MQVQSVWPHNFTIEKQIIDKLINHLALDVQHIGSTSVPGLSAKPIIDILVGVKDGTLDQLIKPMITTYTYIQKYEKSWHGRRLFCRFHPVDSSVPDIITESDPNPSELGLSTSTNIHCIVHNSSDWIRHIAFRDYLIERADVRDQYDRLKNELSQIDYKDMFEYNNAKNDFIKAVEKDAVKWYSQNLTSN